MHLSYPINSWWLREVVLEGSVHPFQCSCDPTDAIRAAVEVLGVKLIGGLNEWAADEPEQTARA